MNTPNNCFTFYKAYTALHEDGCWRVFTVFTSMSGYDKYVFHSDHATREIAYAEVRRLNNEETKRLMNK